jgi:ferredoxin--NADP+ reductase
VGKIYLQDLVHREEFRSLIEGHFDPLTTHAFVCGNPAMIGLPKRNPDGTLSFPKPKGMVETLIELGLCLDEPHRPGTIHFEKYW